MTRSASLPFVVLVVLLALPRVGVAAPSLLSEDSPAPSSPHLLADEPTSEPRAEPLAPTARRTRGSIRVLTEIGTGLVAIIPGSLAGLLISTQLTGCSILSGNERPACRWIVPFSWGLGGGLGASVGVAVAASFVDGEGSYWRGALPGALLGGAAGVGLSFLSTEPAVVALLACPLLMLTGSVIGYEWSHSQAMAHRLQPVVSLSSKGALFGLAGAF
jgi:hypothetical protein